jgi:hypothetical protein
LVPLALIPGNLTEMAIYLAGSWLALGFAAKGVQTPQTIAALGESIWPVMLIGVYLPMLWVVLRTPKLDSAS